MIKMDSTILFVVNASGSMGTQQRMEAAKGAVMSLFLDAYQHRDRVGMIAFKGSAAEVLLPPTSSVELAKKCLEMRNEMKLHPGTGMMLVSDGYPYTAKSPFTRP